MFVRNKNKGGQISVSAFRISTWKLPVNVQVEIELESDVSASAARKCP